MLSPNPFKTFMLRYGRYVSCASNDVRARQECKIPLSYVDQKVRQCDSILRWHRGMNERGLKTLRKLRQNRLNRFIWQAGCHESIAHFWIITD